MAFPSSPVNNQVAIINGVSYTYNSTIGAWVVTSNNSGTSVAITANVITVGNTIIISASNGTPPLTVTSTTKVANLNVDQLDGYTADTAYNSFGSGTIPVRHSSGYLFSNYFNMTADQTTGTVTRLAVETNSDNYLRWQTPSQFLGSQTHYIGTTAIALNRASASQSLTGVSIDGSAGSAATAGTATNQSGGTVSATTATIGTYVYADSSGLTVRTGAGNYGVRVYPGGGSSATNSVIQFTNAAQNAQNGTISLDSATNMSIGTDINLPVIIRSNGATVATFNSTGISDAAGNLRKIPSAGAAKATSYTLATTDVGEFVEVTTSGSIVVPASTFTAGDAITIFNNTTVGITITCSAITTYISGTNTAKTSVTLATRGLCTVMFITPSLCVLIGSVS